MQSSMVSRSARPGAHSPGLSEAAGLSRALATSTAAVRKDIEAILKNKDYDDGSIGPVLVRLAWHAR